MGAPQGNQEGKEREGSQGWHEAETQHEAGQAVKIPQWRGRPQDRAISQRSH